MRRFLATITLLGMTSLGLPAAAEGLFQGEWQQVSSNAGECKTCRVTIHQTGSSLQITANNDWTAIGEVRGRNTAGGAGFWKRGTRKTYSGKTFDIDFQRNGEDELLMLMQIEPIEGRRRIITGIFKRIEQLKI